MVTPERSAAIAPISYTSLIVRGPILGGRILLRAMEDRGNCLQSNTVWRLAGTDLDRL